jgi:hypothetical protein
MSLQRSTKENMKVPEPKRWWFAIPLPCAWILYMLICITHLLLKGCSLLKAMQNLAYAAIGSIWFFPVGLSALFVQNPHLLKHHFKSQIAFGYTLYAILMLWGFIRPHRYVFIVLCMVLLANLVGCQMNQTGRAIADLHWDW